MNNRFRKKYLQGRLGQQGVTSYNFKIKYIVQMISFYKKKL